MSLVFPWILILILLLGNCGFWLFCFNRINATALHRKTIKKIEKIFIILCFVIPLAIAGVEGHQIWAWLTGESPGWLPSSSPIFLGYGCWCLGSFVVLGSSWLESRLWLIPPKHLIASETTRFDVHQEVDGGSPGTKLTHFLRSLPGNEICHLTVTRKQLRLARSIPGVNGLKIGHCSDLHFTGQLRLEHYRFVFDQLMACEPDMIIISGDIIDYEKCLHFIDELFPALQAELGCSFVLGNHDRRLIDLAQLSNQLQSLGHFDLGRANQSIAIGDRTTIELVGNEIPWLSRHENGKPSFPSTEEAEDEQDVLRICVSHAPDQIHWARQRKADLMLAGHTHGGQIRLPGIGPIVAPSFQGTRFASGTFYLAPTLMHVSRGVAGTHPVRWRCPPEISLLTLLSD